MPMCYLLLYIPQNTIAVAMPSFQGSEVHMTEQWCWANVSEEPVSYTAIALSKAQTHAPCYKLISLTHWACDSERFMLWEALC